MSIVRQITYEVVCDRYGVNDQPADCHEFLHATCFTRDDAIGAARAAGWFVRENGAVVRCPSCAPKKKEAR